MIPTKKTRSSLPRLKAVKEMADVPVEDMVEEEVLDAIVVEESPEQVVHQTLEKI